MSLAVLKNIFVLLMLFFPLGLLSFTLWYGHNNQWIKIPLRINVAGTSKDCANPMRSIDNDDTWKRNEDNHKAIISELRTIGRAADLFVVSQANTPLKSELIDSSKKVIKVDNKLFQYFPKESPFTNKTFRSCSVVGNGGILINSTCGKQIDSADFVFRCNLAPLKEGFERDVGKRTDLVTANPSLFYNRFKSLRTNTSLFVEQMQSFGDAWLLLPAFSWKKDISLCLKAIKTLQKKNSQIKPIILNHVFAKAVNQLWTNRNLKERVLSTGFLMLNLALDVCDTVHLYGFWPFDFHPHNFNLITHHYYDNMLPSRRAHHMPSEFQHLMELHRKGVLRIHAKSCVSQDQESQC